jgi:hypothetical protein
MSISTTIGSYFSWASSCVASGVSRVTQAVSNSVDSVCRIGRSVLGREAISRISENIVEYVGYYAGEWVAAPMGKELGEKAGTVVGATIAVAGAYLVADQLADVTCSVVSGVCPKVKRALHTAVLVGVASSTLLTVYEPIVTTVSFSSGVVLESAAGFCGGAAAAFLGIKCFGSREVFWDSSDFFGTYPIKTLTSMIGTNRINYAFPVFECTYIEPIRDLVLGSLIYNARDLYHGAIDVKNGRFLDGTLPSSVVLLPKVVIDQSFELGIRATASPLTELGVREVENRAPFLVIRPFLKDSSKIFEKLLGEALLYCFDPNIAVAVPLKDLSQKGFFSLVVRGLNLHSLIMENCPSLLTSTGSFCEFMQRGADIGRQIPGMNLLRDGIKAYERFKKDPLMEVIEPFFALSDLHFKSFTPADIDFFTDEFMNHLSAAEIDFCGINLTPENYREKVKVFLESNLENIVKCMIAIIPSIVVPLNEGELRNFYTTVAQRTTSFYTPLLGVLAAQAISAFVTHQIEHSEFSVPNDQ